MMGSETGSSHQIEEIPDNYIPENNWHCTGTILPPDESDPEAEQTHYYTADGMSSGTGKGLPVVSGKAHGR